MSERKDLECLPPFPTSLGICIEECHSNRVVGTVKVTPAMANRNGVMHGGAIMTFADTLAGVAASANLPKDSRQTAVESKTNFIRAVTIGETISGCCVPIHVGGKTIILRVDITRQDGKLVATTLQTHMPVDWEKPSTVDNS